MIDQAGAIFGVAIKTQLNGVSEATYFVRDVIHRAVIVGVEVAT